MFSSNHYLISIIFFPSSHFPPHWPLFPFLHQSSISLFPLFLIHYHSYISLFPFFSFPHHSPISLSSLFPFPHHSSISLFPLFAFYLPSLPFLSSRSSPSLSHFLFPLPTLSFPSFTSSLFFSPLFSFLHSTFILPFSFWPFSLPTLPFRSVQQSPKRHAYRIRSSYTIAVPSAVSLNIFKTTCHF